MGQRASRRPSGRRESGWRLVTGLVAIGRQTPDAGRSTAKAGVVASGGAVSASDPRTLSRGVYQVVGGESASIGASSSCQGSFSDCGLPDESRRVITPQPPFPGCNPLHPRSHRLVGKNRRASKVLDDFEGGLPRQNRGERNGSWLRFLATNSGSGPSAGPSPAASGGAVDVFSQLPGSSSPRSPRPSEASLFGAPVADAGQCLSSTAVCGRKACSSPLAPELAGATGGQAKVLVPGCPPPGLGA